ncbi:RIIa domain-containing protein 1 [Echinococcus granulosus]|nr:RIIa domain-containing protein 1 [Echinococcus granulosus]
MKSSKLKQNLPSSASTFDRSGVNDIGVLSTDQQSAMKLVRIQTRKANEIYLREHPEISHMLSAFMREVLEIQPDDIREYAADFFTDPNLKRKVEAIQKENIMETRICHIADNLGQETNWFD